MIASPTKTEDMRVRAMHLETTQIALRMGMFQEAKEIGGMAADLKKKIENHDYTEDDSRRQRIDNIIYRNYATHI